MIAKLSSELPDLTPRQQEYGFEHCFKHYAHRTKGGRITCTECGHRWKSEHRLIEGVCGCTCPHCGKVLEILDSRKRVFNDTAYYAVITTRKGYQVFRYFMVKVFRKVGSPARYNMIEVVQKWLTPDGKSVTLARLRCCSGMYYDLWNSWSDMEIRSFQDSIAYRIDPFKTYPLRRFIPQVKRNGFQGEEYHLNIFNLIKAILSDSRNETLLKAGQVPMFKHSLRFSIDLKKYWPALKICIRNGYNILNPSMWCDYIDMLLYFGKDIHNAKYVCPENLISEHDRLAEKRFLEMERQRMERNEQKSIEEERMFKALKGRFFGLVFSDGTIDIKVLESVSDYRKEGVAMHHCVYANRYYEKEDSLIFSATTADGQRLETVEVSLDTFEVIQSRGVCNSNTEFHDQIIRLVEDNAYQIRQRMAA